MLRTDGNAKPLSRASYNTATAAGDPTHELTRFIQTMIDVESASLGLVAELAWNEAIMATFATLGLGEGLAGLCAYAVIATVIAVAVLI